MSGQLHESYQEQTAGKAGSPRGFGIVFTVVFLIIGLFPLVKSKPPLLVFLALAAVMLIIALCRPALLERPNRWWLKLGELIYHITNPIILGIIFYCVVLPTGLIRRVFNRDPLGLKWQADAQTYWRKRDQDETIDFTRQF